MKSQKSILVVACILAMLGVALGAFGAHALKNLLVANNRVDTYELAVRYHFYHALALFALGAAFAKAKSQAIAVSANLILAGVIFFSGSLYLLAVANLTSFAFVTPIGGVLLLAGWAVATYGFLANRS